MNPLRPGDRFGKFELHQQLAARGIKQTFLAGAPGGQRRVQLTALAVPGTDLERFFPMFQEELERAGFLFHDGVQQIFEFGRIEGVSFYTHEDFEGIDLWTLLEECRRQRLPLPIRCALYLCREVSSALAYAHDRRLEDGRPLNVVHGAVTARDVLIAPSGAVKLGGFGVLRALQRSDDLREVLDDETWALLPPEVRAGDHAIDARTDSYGCAAVLYQALTFRRPEVAPDGRLRLPSTLRRRASDALDELCAENLSADVSRRWDRVERMEAALGRMLYEEAPFFSPRDMGELLTRVFDGSLARAVGENRGGSAAAGGEEAGPAPQDDGDASASKPEWPDVRLPFSPVDQGPPWPDLEPRRGGAAPPVRKGSKGPAIQIGGERSHRGAGTRAPFPGLRFAGGVKPRRRPAWLLWALLALLVAAGATAAWWLSRASDERVERWERPAQARLAVASGPCPEKRGASNRGGRATWVDDRVRDHACHLRLRAMRPAWLVGFRGPVGYYVARGVKPG